MPLEGADDLDEWGSAGAQTSQRVGVTQAQQRDVAHAVAHIETHDAHAKAYRAAFGDCRLR